mmetsp:Transcript_1765/g.4970  ORF Transcript_1765/g.4970 Transcript_1765/m.4970 type:complete len:105 (-) Transcript_1765:37-351(-)
MLLRSRVTRPAVLRSHVTRSAPLTLTRAPAQIALLAVPFARAFTTPQPPEAYTAQEPHEMPEDLARFLWAAWRGTRTLSLQVLTLAGGGEGGTCRLLQKQRRLQ